METFNLVAIVLLVVVLYLYAQHNPSKVELIKNTISPPPVKQPLPVAPPKAEYLTDTVASGIRDMRWASRQSGDSMSNDAGGHNLIELKAPVGPQTNSPTTTMGLTIQSDKH